MLEGDCAARRCARSLRQSALFFFFSLFVWPCSLRDYYSVSNRPFDRGTNLITIFSAISHPVSPLFLLRLRLLTIGRDVRVEQMPYARGVRTGRCTAGSKRC